MPKVQLILRTVSPPIPALGVSRLLACQLLLVKVDAVGQVHLEKVTARVCTGEPRALVPLWAAELVQPFWNDSCVLDLWAFPKRGRPVLFSLKGVRQGELNDPLVLGFSGFLDRGKLVVHARRLLGPPLAYLEV